ncbi:cis-3-hydroxy-L-proline dehydratase [Leucobacter sp. GX24907]
MRESSAVTEIPSATTIIPGRASGRVLYTDTPISMMGGVDPLTGCVIDTHHPLLGQSVSGKILVIPNGRGSCAGSGALFEMLLAGTAPAALVFCREETILPLGAIIAEEFFGRSLPIVRVSPDEHRRLADVESLTVGEAVADGSDLLRDAALETIALSAEDRRMLDGDRGPAARAAMRVVLRAAALEGATELIDVELAHIDGNFYQGPASLAFAERLVELGGRVCIPSTMNSVKVDLEQWRAQGVDPALGEPSEVLAQAYIDLGVEPTYTCAPYWLGDKPAFGQQIVWAESNAVVFANSVLGARTLKYPDYLDILVAITGRAPAAGTHLPLPRRATIRFDVPAHEFGAGFDDSLFPMLGYFAGQITGSEVPVITGLERSGANHDDLRALGAALATTSAAPMFHMVGVTPEAGTLAEACGLDIEAAGDAEKLHTVSVTREDLLAIRSELTSATTPEVGLVAFGNPHFSLTEIERLAGLCDGVDGLAPGTSLMVTCGRAVHRQAVKRGFAQRIERIGGTFITDTCWCLIQEPVIPHNAPTVMTNSAKYAHYGPAQVERGMHFGSFEECLRAAVTGRAPDAPPAWLRAS